MRGTVCLLFLLLLLCHGNLSGWSWSKNMARQPSISALDAHYPVPPGTLARGSRIQVEDRMEAHEKLSNPVPADSLSIRRGGEFFILYCSPCHGITGAGDGPVTEKFIPPPPLFPLVDSRSDGYLYGTIRFGGPIMPPYGESLLDREIWDVANYLRDESGKKRSE